jgi:hypothetical protein
MFSLAGNIGLVLRIANEHSIARMAAFGLSLSDEARNITGGVHRTDAGYSVAG